MKETLLEHYLEKQNERERILLGEEKYPFAFSLSVNPEYLFLALNESKRFILSPSKGELVIRQFGNDETIMVDTSIEEFKRLSGKQCCLNFFYIKSKDNQGFLLSLSVRMEKEENGLISIQIDDKPPLTNELLISKIRNETGIDLSNKKGFIDYREYGRFIVDSIARSSIELFADKPYLTEDIIYDYFLWREINNESQPLRRLDSSTPAYDSGYKVNHCPILPLRRIFEKLENEEVVFVRSENKKLKDILFTYFLKEKLRDKKAILIGANSKEKVNEFKEKLSKTTYKNIIPNHFFGSKDFNLLEETKKMMTTKGVALSDIASIYKRNWNISLSEYIRNDYSQGSALLKTGEDWLTGVNKFSLYHNLRTNSVPLDVDKYTSSDFANDQRFMSFFRKAIYVNKGILRKNPLYSLRVKGTSDTFQAMRASLNKAWNDIDNLQSKVSLAQGKDWGVGNIYSISSLEKSLKKIKIILEYNGFSDFFFKLIDNPKAMQVALTLSSLKERKDKYFETICEYVVDLSKLDEPLNRYLELAKSKKFFERHEGKQKLKKVLRDKRDLADFIETLTKYQEVLTQYDEKTKEAESLFGLILYSDEGPKKALEALRFLDEYRNLIKEDERCDKEKNSFVKKIFDDYAFRENERTAIKQIELSLLSIKEDFTNLKDIFAEPFHEETLSFTLLKQDLKVKEEVSFEEFKQYSELQDWIKKASYTLKEAITTFDAVNEPLNNFENDYWYSLYKAFALEIEKKGANSPMKAAMALCCFEPYVIDDDGIKVFNNIKRRIIEEWSSSIDAQQIQDVYRYGGEVMSYRVLDYFSDFAKKVCPLQICCPSSLPLSKIKFDYVVIDNPKDFAIDQIALLLSRGTKAIIISDEKDERFSGYGEEILNEDSLFKYGLHYEDLSDDFLNLLAYGFEENGYEILNAEESKTSMGLSYRDENGVLHPVVPDCLISQNSSLNVKVILNSLLLYLGKEPIVLVSSLMLMANPKKAVEEAIKNAKVL